MKSNTPTYLGEEVEEISNSITKQTNIKKNKLQTNEKSKKKEFDNRTSEP